MREEERGKEWKRGEEKEEGRRVRKREEEREGKGENESGRE